MPWQNDPDPICRAGFRTCRKMAGLKPAPTGRRCQVGVTVDPHSVVAVLECRPRTIETPICRAGLVYLPQDGGFETRPTGPRCRVGVTASHKNREGLRGDRGPGAFRPLGCQAGLVIGPDANVSGASPPRGPPLEFGCLRHRLAERATIPTQPAVRPTLAIPAIIVSCRTSCPSRPTVAQ